MSRGRSRDHHVTQLMTQLLPTKHETKPDPRSTARHSPVVPQMRNTNDTQRSTESQQIPRDAHRSAGRPSDMSAQRTPELRTRSDIFFLTTSSRKKNLLTVTTLTLRGWVRPAPLKGSGTTRTTTTPPPYGATPPHPGAGPVKRIEKILPVVDVLQPPEHPLRKRGVRRVGRRGGRVRC